MKTPACIKQMLVHLSAAFIFIMALGGPQAAFAGKPYQHYVVGDSTDVVVQNPPSTPSLVLMGGGPDVDDAFKKMIGKSGGGNFVVIRATGTDAYNPYIYAMGGVSSVETLIIPSREAASNSFVLTRINGADALFIAGGDQSDYINFWQGTPVEAAIQNLASRNVPIGGTSAGLAVMGQYAFTALRGTITSTTALSNPYDRTLTLGRDFLTLPDMSLLITDAHLDSRDRMGRLITFMARIVQDGWSGSTHGVGVDVETALWVDNGIASRVGVGSAYFLKTVGMPEVCKPKTPLTYRNLGVQRLSGSGTFDMRNWASYDEGTTNYSISAIKGVLSSTQAGGAIY
jgi:cyanophycinase